MPVLDTNFLIGLEQADTAAVAVLGRIRRLSLVVPYQAALEFATGASDVDEAIRLVAELAEVAGPDEHTMRAAIRLARRRREQGGRNHAADLWVAACAAARSDYVVSADKRAFSAYGVGCWDWRRDAAPPPA